MVTCLYIALLMLAVAYGARVYFTFSPKLANYPLPLESSKEA
jgi:hypothetical protein